MQSLLSVHLDPSLLSFQSDPSNSYPFLTTYAIKIIPHQITSTIFSYPLLELVRAACCRAASASTSAAMASTMGTARGTTHGSCRPRASRTAGEPSYADVVWAWAMVAGGLKATENSMSAPLVMPP